MYKFLRKSLGARRELRIKGRKRKLRITNYDFFNHNGHKEYTKNTSARGASANYELRITNCW